MSKFVAHVNNTIFGVGDTPAAALADAREWVDGGNTDVLETTPATDRLVEAVAKDGSDVGWTVGNDSIADLSRVEAFLYHNGSLNDREIDALYGLRPQDR